MKTTGVDGCRSGWFSVSLTETTWDMTLHKTIESLWDSCSGSESILIDIPIGFRTDEAAERLCDLAARKVIGPGRGSSVFPTPCRSALICSNYEAGHLENKRCVDRGLSKQTWAIVPKIREVDAFLVDTPEARSIVRESHPEVAFWGLNGQMPLKHNKKAPEGLRERIEILSRHEERTLEIYQAAMAKYLRKEVASDDIIDALCLAVTGQIIAAAGMHTLPEVPETDACGLPMQIVYASAGMAPSLSSPEHTIKPAGLSIDHLNRYVSDVDTFIEFYSKALDYALIDKGMKESGKPYAILKGDGHELFISEKDDYTHLDSNFRHIGYSIENADTALERLKSLGIMAADYEIIVKPYSRQFYVTDPDGFEIDFIQWTDKAAFYTSLKAKMAE